MNIRKQNLKIILGAAKERLNLILALANKSTRPQIYVRLLNSLFNQVQHYEEALK
jgi:hypothetical protein